MTPSRTTSPTGPLGLSPLVAGTLCCAVSALAYTAANCFMRQLSALGCDYMWAVANKEAVTVLTIGPWLLAEAVCGRRVLPRWPTLALLVLVALAVELGGNLGFQWAFGMVGLAITVAVTVGATLTGSAALGRLFLSERVSLRSGAALAVLLSSLALLTLGAEAAGRSVSPGSGPLWIAAGVVAAALAGVVYAVFTVTIRHAVTGDTRPGLLMLVITGVGVLSLAPLSLCRLGAAPLLESWPRYGGWMLAAGACNLVGFLSITKGLQLTTVVRVSALNASQVALAAVAGVMIFHEPSNAWLDLGVALTIAGVVLIDRPPAQEPLPEAPLPEAATAGG